MYSYNINTHNGMNIGEFIGRAPRKSKRYSMNRKALEKKRYSRNIIVSGNSPESELYGIRVPGNTSINQNDKSSLQKTINYIPLPPNISQQNYNGIIGELNRAYLDNNSNDVLTTQREAHPILQSSKNVMQNSKVTPSRACAQPPHVPSMAPGLPFPPNVDAFGLQQLNRNINYTSIMSSQNACAVTPRTISSNATYMSPCNATAMTPQTSRIYVPLETSEGAGAAAPKSMCNETTYMSPCNAGSMIPQTAVGPPQGVCTAVPANYTCAVQTRLPCVPTEYAVFMERLAQQQVWQRVQMLPSPNMIGFWDYQGQNCNIPYVQNNQNQDMNHLPSYNPMLSYSQPYQKPAVDSVHGYQASW